MWQKIVQTGPDVSAFLLRLTLGLVILPHGAQKLLGWFGGYGWSGTLGFFTDALGIPMLLGALVILVESVGALGLLLGFLTRAVALGIAAIMAAAAALVHGPNGFFMNWAGTQKGEGFEFHVLALGLALALVLTGGGRWSVDRRLAQRR